MLAIALAGLITAAPATEPTPQVHFVSEQRAYAKAGIEVRMLVEDGDAYLGRLAFDAGTYVPPHRHETSEEFITLTSGEGEMLIGGKPVRLKAGDAVRIPKNVLHDFRAVGSGKVEAVQVYSPRGPEDRFRAWPAK